MGTRVTQKDKQAAGLTDAEKDSALAPVGYTLDPDRTWTRETCSECGAEAVLEVPDEVEVADPDDPGEVRWDCPNNHRNVFVAPSAKLSQAAVREVNAGDSGSVSDRS